MNFSWWTFALQAANFLILIWLLQRFLFKPVKAIVARRKEEISRALNEASAQKESAQRLKQEIETARSAINTERQKMIAEERALLAAEREKIIEESRREAEKVRAQAMRRIDEDRADASDKLFERTIELATTLAERLLGEVTNGSIEHPFLGRVIDHLDRMPAEERAKLLLRNGGSELLVMTAHPLDVEEQTQWREQLGQRLGTNFTVRFEVDPKLIAGTVITFPHAILNFNWRDTIERARKEIHGSERSR